MISLHRPQRADGSRIHHQSFIFQAMENRTAVGELVWRAEPDQFFERACESLELSHFRSNLEKLSFRLVPDVAASSCRPRSYGQEVTNLPEREPHGLRLSDKSQASFSFMVIQSVPRCGSTSRGKEVQPFVIADRLDIHDCRSSQLTDRQCSHCCTFE